MKLYSHTLQIFAALIVTVGLTFVTGRYTEWVRDAEPVSNWVEMRSIYVPDFSLDELDKAVIIADIDRKEPFSYISTVTAEPVIENRDFDCSGQLARENIPGDKLPPNGFPFNQIFKNPCKWYPGEFKFLITWIIHREGYNMKTASWETPVFRVLPEGALPYVPQEQIQQLEAVQQKVDQLEEVIK